MAHRPRCLALVLDAGISPVLKAPMSFLAPDSLRLHLKQKGHLEALRILDDHQVEEWDAWWLYQHFGCDFAAMEEQLRHHDDKNSMARLLRGARPIPTEQAAPLVVTVEVPEDAPPTKPAKKEKLKLKARTR